MQSGICIWTFGKSYLLLEGTTIMRPQHYVKRQYTSSRLYVVKIVNIYEGWNFNSGNYLFTTDTK